MAIANVNSGQTLNLDVPFDEPLTINITPSGTSVGQSVDRDFQNSQNITITPASQIVPPPPNLVVTFTGEFIVDNVGLTYIAAFDDNGTPAIVTGTILDAPDVVVDFSVSDNVGGSNVTYEGIVNGYEQYSIPPDYNSGVLVSLANGSDSTYYRLEQGSDSENYLDGRIVDLQKYSVNPTLGITGRGGTGVTSELPENGQNTYYIIKASLTSSGGFELCRESDNSDAQFYLRRADFVAPVLADPNTFLVGNSGANVQIEVKIEGSSFGSGGYLRYAQSTSSTLPSTTGDAWKVSNLFDQDRDTTRWYFAARLYDHPDEGTNVEAFDREAFFAGYLAPDTNINTISDKLIGPDASNFQINIINGDDSTVYQVRVSSASGLVLNSIAGSGAINITSSLPAFGEDKPYYLTAYRLDEFGGDETVIYPLPSPNDVFFVERSYYVVDPCNPIANFDVDQDNATFSINVTGTDSRTVHELRETSYSGAVVDTCTGNNQTLSDSADWTIGTSKPYYITAYLPSASGGAPAETRTNVDSFTVTRAYDVPGAPTALSFSPASTASADINITVTITPPTGNFTSVQVRKDGGEWRTATSNQYTFVAPEQATRGTESSYEARAVNGTSVGGTFTDTFTPNYLGTSASITAIPDQTIDFTAVNFTITIAGGQATQVYQVRETSASGTVLKEGIGNNPIIVDSGLPAAESFKDYYITTYRTEESGGNPSNILNTGEVVRITKEAATVNPDPFDAGLGPDAEGVILDSGLYTSLQSTITGINTNVTATFAGDGGFRVNGAGLFTADSKTVGPNQTVQIGINAANTSNTPRTGTITIGSETGDFTVRTEDTGTGSGPITGDGGEGTWGLRCFNSLGEITLDVTDRVSTVVATVVDSLGVGELSKTIDLGRSGTVGIWKNPTENFTKLDVLGNLVPNTDELLEIEVNGSNLEVSRDTAGTVVNFTVLVVNG